jgi:hypothetical protein
VSFLNPRELATNPSPAVRKKDELAVNQSDWDAARCSVQFAKS